VGAPRLALAPCARVLAWWGREQDPLAQRDFTRTQQAIRLSADLEPP